MKQLSNNKKGVGVGSNIGPIYLKTRICKGCGIEKEVTKDNFYPHSRVRVVDGTKPYFSTLCISCHNKSCLTRNADTPIAHRVMLQASRYARDLGATSDELESILTRVFGTCEICGGEPDKHRLCIDHDHATGKIRGLLCQGCNKALAGLKDNPETARKAALYLEKYTCPQDTKK